MPILSSRGGASAKATGFTGATGAAPGSQSYTCSGTYTWVAPAGVTSVSVVAVGGGGSGQYNGASGGGGGLGYKNNYSVTPGSSYTVVVGARGITNACGTGTPQAGTDSYFVSTGVVKGGGGQAGIGYTGPGGTYAGDGGGNGGTGRIIGGGGGAGGYSGNGGNGGGWQNLNATAGSGGGGGGGGPANGWTTCCGFVYGAGGGGGGVGILGQGSNGTAGTITGANTSTGGGGGSGGASGGCGLTGYYSNGGIGGNYGGGGGTYTKVCASYGRSTAGKGAVRIVWPGSTRQFPSTNVGAP